MTENISRLPKEIYIISIRPSVDMQRKTVRPGQRVKKGVLGSQSYRMPCREGEWGVIGLYLETWSEQHCRVWPLPSAPAQSSGGCDRCKRYTCCRCTCSVTWRGCRNTHRQKESVSCDAFPQELDPKGFAIHKVGLEMEGCRKVSTTNNIENACTSTDDCLFWKNFTGREKQEGRAH